MFRKIALVATTALIITLLLPQRATLNIQLTPGEIHTGESVIAPFDIPIYKSIEQLDSARRELLDGFQPIFRMDSTVAPMQLKLLAAELDDKVSAGRRDSIIAAVSYIYHRGITLEADRATYIDKIVRVDSAHILSRRFATDLFTPGSALTYLASLGYDTDHLARYITPSIIYDPSLTTHMRDQQLGRLSRTQGIVRSGEVIVARGEMVDARVETLITSFRREYESRMGTTLDKTIFFLGRFIMMLIIITVNYLFFTKFSGQHFQQRRHLLFVFVLYVIMAAFMSLVVRISPLSPYVVPLPLVALLLMAFFDTRVAIFGHISTVLIASFFVRFSFDFFTINFIGGIVAIFVVRHYYHRNSLLKAVGAILLTEIATYVALQWMARGTLNIGYSHLLWFAINAFLTLALYQMVYIFERLFGFVSDITLLELSDTNQPLLLELSEKAPGTFQHSLQVASLAESAAKEIGANSLLARTGALYHDVGKIENPFYFVENQSRDFNPHSMLSPEQSAAIVRRHVTDGVELARKYRLPSRIQEFITGHHGTSKIYYFFAEQMRLAGAVDHIETFTYPGPKLTRREVAICMMADSVEAASRSLSTYDRAEIDELVDRIIDRQVSEHQLSDADISFKEVSIIKEVFKSKLNNIYHNRVVYPAEA